MHFCKMKSKAETMLWSAITLLALAMTAAQNSTSASAGDDGANDDDCAGGICDTTPYIQKLWATHGILMILGWVILIPTAITASLCRRFLPDALWFTIHTFLNWTAFFLIFLSFVIAVYIKQVTQDLPHFAMDSPHRALGLAIFILVTIQVSFGFFRPHLPKTLDTEEKALEVKSTEEISGESSELGGCEFLKAKPTKPAAHAVVQKSSLRSAWEICHRMFGLLMLSLAWLNCYSGLGAYQDAEGESLFSDQACLLAVVGTIGGVLLIAFSAKSSMLL